MQCCKLNFVINLRVRSIQYIYMFSLSSFLCFCVLLVFLFYGLLENLRVMFQEKSCNAEKYLVQVLNRGNHGTETLDNLRSKMYHQRMSTIILDLPSTSHPAIGHILRAFSATHIQINCLRLPCCSFCKCKSKEHLPCKNPNG